MTRPHDTILIVGAGPTGLTLANFLALHGVRAEVIDSSDGPVPESRALAVHSRTLELMESIGVHGELISRGRMLNLAQIRDGDEVLAALDLSLPGEGAGATRYPFVLAIEQSQTQRVLLERAERAGVSVRWGTKLEELDLLDSGARAVVSCGGAREETMYDWVIGCDGARSRVREGAGIASEPLGDHDGPWYLADVCVPGCPFSQEHLIADVGGSLPLAMIPLSSEQTWRVVVPNVEAGDDGRVRLSVDQIEELIKARTGWRFAISRLDWQSSFTVRHRLAQTYQSGHVLLAGDAAHIHSPVGGQGMNTGMQDAVALAWRLARVAKGMAPGELLEQYGAERRPVASRLLGAAERATSALASQSTFMSVARRTLVRWFVGRETVQSKILPVLRMIDVSYEGFDWNQDIRGGGVSASEQPGFGSRRAFSHGPSAGARAPSGAVLEAGEERDVYDVLDRRGFNLVLFDGPERTEEGYARMHAAHESARRALGDEVQTLVVWDGEPEERVVASFEEVGARCVRDAGGSLAAAFGARSECGYMLRPDAYVGWRSQPLDVDSLEVFLRGAAWVS